MEATKDTREIAATSALCFQVVTDMERYPEWASDVKDVSVLERDRDGRPTLVSFRAGAFGRSASYTLAYDYTHAPTELRWHQVAGDVTSRMDGRYAFEETGEQSTLVTYELAAELVVPLPSFVKRRAEVKIIRTALEDLAARVATLAHGASGGDRRER